MFEKYDKLMEALARAEEAYTHVRKHRIRYAFGAGLVVGVVGGRLLSRPQVCLSFHAATPGA